MEPELQQWQRQHEQQQPYQRVLSALHSSIERLPVVGGVFLYYSPAFTTTIIEFMDADKEKLLCGLFEAYFNARRNKRNTHNQLRFEINFESKLMDLYEKILDRSYRPSPGIAFIITSPVKREVLAADFCDRVVHHLLFNLINPVFEATFIDNSFSCRKGKGTICGVKTLEKEIISCSRGYQEDCFILKLDIAGYFMSINKIILTDILHQGIKAASGLSEADKSLAVFLTDALLTDNPTLHCRMKGSRSDWDGLPPSKSLFSAATDCGLPIGNLTSQLFSNIYLNGFDHYIRDTLGIEYYGRYVDDFYIVHKDRHFLRRLIPVIETYLKENLALQLHPKKIFLQHHSKGINFLGATIKPHRRYISNRTKHHFKRSMHSWEMKLQQGVPEKSTLHQFRASINSYLGILRHHRTFNIRKKVLLSGKFTAAWQYGYLSVLSKNRMVYRLYCRPMATPAAIGHPPHVVAAPAATT